MRRLIVCLEEEEKEDMRSRKVLFILSRRLKFFVKEFNCFLEVKI